MATLGEFELIERFFTRPTGRAALGIGIGIGDDCALLSPLRVSRWPCPATC
jgi:thiamine-monophosphate kinase